ncbi:hypothetical protein VTO73DRAFT_2407 [Trametes versicolor]
MFPIYAHRDAGVLHQKAQKPLRLLERTDNATCFRDRRRIPQRPHARPQHGELSQDSLRTWDNEPLNREHLNSGNEVDDKTASSSTRTLEAGETVEKGLHPRG